MLASLAATTRIPHGGALLLQAAPRLAALTSLSLTLRRPGALLGGSPIQALGRCGGLRDLKLVVPLRGGPLRLCPLSQLVRRGCSPRADCAVGLLSKWCLGCCETWIEQLHGGPLRLSPLAAGASRRVQPNYAYFSAWQSPAAGCIP